MEHGYDELVSPASGGVLGADPTRMAATIRVWDPFIRLTHWALATAIAVALLTSLVLPPTWISAHIVAGTLAAGLVAARVVWGFLGPGTARFAGFVPTATGFFGHVRELRDGTAHRHVGHNPMGGAMIVALLATILVITLTGTLALGGSLKSGPFAFATGFAAGELARHAHQLLAYGLIGLIAVHIGGAIFESRRSRENLVRAMVDGRKAARPGDILPAARPPHTLITVTIVAAIFTVATAGIVVLDRRPAEGVPTAPLDRLYAQECGACHMAYHPSLAPAATWVAIMDGLGQHFGEDASLDPPAAAAIRAYLIANSAETADTRAANRFRARNPADPLRITATPFWQRMHRGVAAAVFAAPAVGGPGACGACHQDAASGRFNSSLIAIPQEALP